MDIVIRTEKFSTLLGIFDLTSPNFRIFRLRDIDQNIGFRWQDVARLGSHTFDAGHELQGLFSETIACSRIGFDDRPVYDQLRKGVRKILAVACFRVVCSQLFNHRKG